MKQIIAQILCVLACVPYAFGQAKDPFIKALKKGDLALVENFLNDGVSVNAPTTSGSLPLEIAASRGNAELIRLLARYGANVNPRRGNVSPPIVRAMIWGPHKSAMEALLDNGADINARNPKNGDTLFIVACSKGRFDIVKMLANRGADIHAANQNGDTALFVFRQDFPEMAEYLINLGMNVNSANKEGRTPLLATCGKRHTKTVNVLLKHGANVNAMSRAKRTTPLMGAGSNMGIVKDLLAHGADINIKDADGNTALDRLAKYGRYEIMDVLLSHSKRNGTFDSLDLANAMTLAIQSGYGKPIQLLLDNGVELYDGNGDILLFRAARNGHTDVVRLLLENGADANVRINNNHSALSNAARNGHEETVAMLLKHGADGGLKTDGMTPMAIAAKKGHIRVVQELLKKRADLCCELCYVATFSSAKPFPRLSRQKQKFEKYPARSRRPVLPCLLGS